MIAGHFPDNPYQLVQFHIVVTGEKDISEDDHNDIVDTINSALDAALESIVNIVLEKHGHLLMISSAEGEGKHVSS